MTSDVSKSPDIYQTLHEMEELEQDTILKDANSIADRERAISGKGAGALDSPCFDKEQCQIVMGHLQDIEKKISLLQNDTSKIRKQTDGKPLTYHKKKFKQTPKKHRTVSTMTTEDKATQTSSTSFMDNGEAFEKLPKTSDNMASDENIENMRHENMTTEEIVLHFFKNQKSDCKSVNTGTENLKMIEQTKKDITARRILDDLMPWKCRNKIQNMRNTDQVFVYPLFESSRNFDEFIQKELRSENPLRSMVTMSASNHVTVLSFTQGISSASSLEMSAVESPHSMNMELIRLASFSNFPSSHLLSSIKLARCGFYFTGENDKVACFACNATYSGWQEGDKPEEVHQRISPKCPFVSGKQNVNIPIGNDDEILQNSIENISYDATGLNEHHKQYRQVSAACEESGTNSVSSLHRQSRDDVTASSSSENIANLTLAPVPHGSESTRAQQDRINEFIRQLDPLGISFDRPKYPSYAVLATRISSFADWPTNLRQTPCELATAGFLYAGYGDYTRCFFCGGGLRNWESDDDPWVEHARWFPKCVYVRQNKGDDFVALVQIEHQAQEARDVALGASNLEIPPPTYNNGRRSSTNEIETRAANENRAVTHTSTASDILSLPSCQSVLEMGYSPETVRLAIKEVQRVKDLEKIPGDDLMDIILLKEEKGNNRGQMENNRDTLSVSSSGISQTNVSSGLNDHSNAEIKSTEEAGAQSMEMLSRQLDNTILEDTRSLIQENRQLKNQRRCKICLEEDASIVMLPCGHLCCCPECAPAMRKCPICRQFVKGTVKTWLV